MKRAIRKHAGVTGDAKNDWDADADRDCNGNGNDGGWDNC